MGWNLQNDKGKFYSLRYERHIPCHRWIYEFVKGWGGFFHGYFCPKPFAKAGNIKAHCPSLRRPVSLSVTKTLTWLMSTEVFIIDHWYLTWIILVISPLYWYHVVTWTFDLLQGHLFFVGRGTTDLRIWLSTIWFGKGFTTLKWPQNGIFGNIWHIHCSNVWNECRVAKNYGNNNDIGPLWRFMDPKNLKESVPQNYFRVLCKKS